MRGRSASGVIVWVLVAVALYYWPFACFLWLFPRGPRFLSALASTVLVAPYGLVGSYLIVRASRVPRWRWVLSACGLLILSVAVSAGITINRLNRDSMSFGECAHNIRAVGVALQLYATDHGRLPRSAVWVDAIGPYLLHPDELTCPANPVAGASSYAMNSRLGGAKMADLHDAQHTVLVYETRMPGANPAGLGADMPSPGLHRYPRLGAKERFNFVVTADGKLHEGMPAGARW